MNKRALNQRGIDFGLKALSDLEERDIDWIWYPYLARGELTIVEGDPEAKKSFMIQAAARRLMDGRELPSKWPELQAPPGNVVLFDCENDGETVLKRRFRYLGLKNEDMLFLKQDPFQMVEEDIDNILLAVRPLRPLMVVFDTMNDYFDSDRNPNLGRDVTQALQPFKRMAKELNCAVVLVRHLTKGTGKAMYRGSGSISFAGKARIVIAVAPHPEEEGVSCMALTKSSNTSKPKALTYEVRDRSTPEEKYKFRFAWGDEADLTADDILNVEREPGRPSEKRDHAKDWLRSQLANGPVSVKTLQANAEKYAISWMTVRRAADDLGVKKPKGGPGAAWRLP